MGEMLSLSTLLLYYKRKDIQNEIIRNASEREVAVKFGEKGFGKRPDTLQYPDDILELAKQGATSFHVSEEIWDNPLRLSPTIKRKELDDMRKGWDLILDIDCNELEYSKIAADLLIKAMKHQGIKSISCKFSGNHGFHIAVPFKSFPQVVHNQETKSLFPEAPRKIAAYLKEMIRKRLSEEILKKDDASTVAKKFGKKFNDIVKDGSFDPFAIMEIDTILISSRHLYRMPYSFNEKSGLVSVPVDPSKVMKFDKESAKPENVAVSHFRFLDDSNAVENEARDMIVQAMDYTVSEEENKAIGEMKAEKEGEFKRHFEEIQTAVPEEFFPPCIKLGLKGLVDGKKRFLFILVNFLTSVGWSYEDIEKRIKEWNNANPEPLRETIIVGQLRYHQQNRKKILPPNCDNQMYYKGMLICHPDNLCGKIKNPVNYSRRKTFYLHREIEKETGKRSKKNVDMEQ